MQDQPSSETRDVTESEASSTVKAEDDVDGLAVAVEQKCVTDETATSASDVDQAAAEPSVTTDQEHANATTGESSTDKNDGEGKDLTSAGEDKTDNCVPDEKKEGQQEQQQSGSEVMETEESKVEDSEITFKKPLSNDNQQADVNSKKDILHHVNRNSEDTCDNPTTSCSA